MKLSKVFTHGEHLKRSEKDLGECVRAIQGRGPKLGCLLIQLPPKLKFDRADAEVCFKSVRDILQRDYRISRVIADPQPYFPRVLEREDFFAVAYLRLHGAETGGRSGLVHV